MNLLHIGHITENKSNGINVVVPQHIINQSKIEGVNVALLNISRDEKGLNNIKHFSSDIQGNHFLDKLKAPFNKPDLVIFHGIYYIKFIKIYKILIKNNIPYIIIPHGSLVKKAIKTHAIKKYTAHLLMFNKFIKNSKAIQFLTEGEKENSIFSKKGIVLPNGFYFGSNEFKKNKQLDNINIIFIGRKNRIHKGLDLLMKAINKKKDFLIKNNVKFFIIGPDRIRTNAYINRMIEKNKVENIVENLDAVYGIEKEKILTNGDIFVHTSRCEGLPTAVVEAMIYKMPILVTRGTNMYEIAKDKQCGWGAENNVKSISQQFDKIIEEKNKIKEYGENAYKYAKENYEWTKVAKESINIYRNLIKGIKEK